ncbi:hypothetical protein FH609_000475 [Streptomyces sp. 3MP-14]|uniref:Uncharacterized protein n=1 Tax=Streptomyces mimosae TaxID=2586635 RepID=A0A5N6ASN4_9ACTN|nr:MULTISPECIES: hypothetical protein [Streptomyces]KAB8171112.1 hypothetical protein FH607_001995 [Streptomyces mimosae]KAB8179536.1 hypothetical protein FH609_000475 [Streptomyces sp. 3MP-14]
MRDEALTPITITPDTVRLLDVLDIGGRQLRVIDLRALRAGHKLLIFETGETLTLTPRSLLNGGRAVPYESPWRRTPGPWGRV